MAISHPDAGLAATAAEIFAAADRLARERASEGPTAGAGKIRPMVAILLAFLASVAVTAWIVRVMGRDGSFALDRDITGPQKFHVRPVPRIGGLGIVAGVLVAAAVLGWMHPSAGLAAVVLLGCGVPAFAAGFIEDLTKRVSPALRLLAMAVSASLAFWLLGAQITRIDIPGIESQISVGAGALWLTVVAVVGVANSVNIIDGFNGLASMCVMIILAALAYVASQVGDSMVGMLALVGIGAVLGFFLWNFPSGKIFLGDGGAYFLGFYAAELSILLLVRNPAVSPLFPLLVLGYPVFETIFSIYRRRFLRATPLSMPDGIHLHSLIYRRVLRWGAGDRSATALTRRNSMTSPFLWLLCLVSVVPAVLFWDNSMLIAVSLVIFATSYVALYWRIVRFKSPRWMRVLANRPVQLQESDSRGF